MRTQLIVTMYGDIINPASSPLQNWLTDMESWAAELKVPPHELSGKFKQEPRGLVSRNAYKLAKYRSRFIEQLEANNVDDLDIICLWPGWHDRGLDWDFFSLYAQDPPAGVIFAVGMSMERLTQVPSVSALTFVQDAVCRARFYLSVKYGLAVTMPRRFMPGFYALGMASGELPQELDWDANAWGRYDSNRKPWRAECDHSLRNIYGYNVLTAKHLDIRIGGQRLGDWIEASGGRGRIEPLSESLFLWTFQKGDDQEAFLAWDYPPVVRVREELKRYEIFPWQKMLREWQEPLE